MPSNILRDTDNARIRLQQSITGVFVDMSGAGSRGQKSAKNGFSLMNAGALTREQAEWLQAGQIYKIMEEMRENEKRIPFFFQRFVFERRFKGAVETDESGKTVFCCEFSDNGRQEFDDFNDARLQNKICEYIERCVKERGIQISDTESVRSWVRGLLNDERKSITRLKAIQACIALNTDITEVNEILCNGLYGRKLSPVFPDELIYMYCIQKGYPWSSADLNQTTVESLMRELISYKYALNDIPPLTDQDTLTVFVSWANKVWESDEAFKNDLKICVKKATSRTHYQINTKIPPFIRNAYCEAAKNEEFGLEDVNRILEARGKCALDITKPAEIVTIYCAHHGFPWTAKDGDSVSEMLSDLARDCTQEGWREVDSKYLNVCEKYKDKANALATDKDHFLWDVLAYAQTAGIVRENQFSLTQIKFMQDPSKFNSDICCSSSLTDETILKAYWDEMRNQAKSGRHTTSNRSQYGLLYGRIKENPGELLKKTDLPYSLISHLLTFKRCSALLTRDVDNESEDVDNESEGEILFSPSAKPHSIQRSDIILREFLWYQQNIWKRRLNENGVLSYAYEKIMDAVEEIASDSCCTVEMYRIAKVQQLINGLNSEFSDDNDIKAFSDRVVSCSISESWADSKAMYSVQVALGAVCYARGLNGEKIHQVMDKFAEIVKKCDEKYPPLPNKFQSNGELVAKENIIPLFWNRSFSDAQKEQNEFQNVLDRILEQMGYKTSKESNALDALIKLVMYSICPLETFARVYEIAVAKVEDSNLMEAFDGIIQQLEQLEKLEPNRSEQINNVRASLDKWICRIEDTEATTRRGTGR